jgi:hypothetical protein
MRWLLAIGFVVLASVQARADEPAHAVALLPLDADAKMELYGQPVASEVARSLVKGGIEVVVVGPKMAVPAQARLVVDGTIKADKGGSVTITVRIRDASDGSVYDTIPVTAASQTAIDHAAEELSAKVLPSVRGRLAALVEADRLAAEPKQKPVEKPVPQAKQPSAMMLVRTSGIETLAKPLAAALEPWAMRRHHATRTIVEKVTPAFVTAQHADFSIELEVKSVTIDRDDVGIPLATAKVHVRIVDAQAVVFDRTIVTDTIVGEKKLDDAKLLERVAREVLAITDPNVKRRISTWF